MARRRYQPYYLRNRTRQAYNSGWFSSRRGSPWSIGTFGADYASSNPEQRMLRRATGFKGKGAYWGQQAGKWLGNLAGRYTGISELGALGSKYGDIGSSWVEKQVAAQVTDPNSWSRKRFRGLTGMGAYSGDVSVGTTANDLFVDRSGADTTPNFMSDPDEVGCVYVNFTEYVTDIMGNNSVGDTVVNTIEINPGLESTFPFLSQIAACFEEYEMLQLVYVYSPDISDNFVTNDGTTGTVYFATQYNLNNDPLTNFRQFETSTHRSSGLCYQRILHGIEMDPNKVVGRPSKFIRVAPLPIGEAPIDYDPCFLQYAVYDTPAGLANRRLGKLHVQYTVKLRRPRQYADRISTNRTFMISGAYAGAQTSGGGDPIRCPWGTNMTGMGHVQTLFAQQNSLPLTVLATNPAGFSTLNLENSSYGLWDPIGNTGAVAMPQWVNMSSSALTNVILIPSDFTGVLEMRLSVQTTTPSGNASAGTYVLSPPLLEGNVRPLADMIGGSLFDVAEAVGPPIVSRDQPSAVSRNYSTSIALTSCTRLLTLVLRVVVSPPPPGGRNAFVWSNYGNSIAVPTAGTVIFSGSCPIIGTQIPSTSLIVNSSSLTIIEGTRQMGRSASNPVPIFVDSSGTVVSPF